MAMVRVINYYHKCDACGKTTLSDGTDPKVGTVGRLEFPNSAYGQRRAYSFYSCKEQAAHVIKAMRNIVEIREADIQGRKTRGEQYSAPKD